MQLRPSLIESQIWLQEIDAGNRNAEVILSHVQRAIQEKNEVKCEEGSQNPEKQESQQA